MPLGPRKREGMLTRQGKICNPPAGSPTKKQSVVAPDGGTQNKQYKQDKGKPYKGPNYSQPAKGIKLFGGK